MSLKSTLLAATLSLIPLASLAEEAKIMVMDSYARSSSPSAKSGAIFLELQNHGPADRLIGAATDIANMTQLHTHQEDANGVMRMLHVEEGFEVPENGTVMLKRGGKHVMLMGLSAPLLEGTTVLLTLTFENAGEITVNVPVDLSRKPGAHGGSGHGTHGLNDS